MSRHYKAKKWVVKDPPKEPSNNSTPQIVSEKKVINHKQLEEERRLQEAKKAEEQKRLEIEKKMLEEKKLQEEKERVELEEKNRMMEIMASLELELSHIQALSELRKKNEDAKSTQLDNASLRKLNASLQKNTTFIKKLSTKISNDNKDNLLKELRTLNLSKYISEVVNAISTINLKSTDTTAAVAICSEFHQLYAEFTDLLIPSLSKIVSSGPSNETMIKKRVTLKLLTELFISGLFKDSHVLLTCLKDIMESKDSPLNILQLIVTFARSASKDMFNINVLTSSNEKDDETLMNLSPEYKDKIHALQTQIIEEHDQFTSVLFQEDKRKSFLNILNKFFEKISALLLKEHQSLRSIEKSNQETLQNKGELNEATRNEYTKTLDQYNKLRQFISTLASLMTFEMIELPEEENVSRVVDKEVQKTTTEEKKETEHIWDDDDMYKFYEVLPDLKDYVSSTMLGIKDSNVTSEESSFQNESTSLTEESTQILDDKAETIDKTESTTEENKESEESNTTAFESEKFQSFLVKLNNCVNRDLIDKAAIEFCQMNQKLNRRKLVLYLFNVSRTKLEILPYFSRFVAILYPYISDIGKDLVAKLEEEFNSLFSEKDQIKVESKIKNIRFLSELVKFKVCPANLIFNCLSLCLNDFKHHNIEVACNLLETCGRFLYKFPPTSTRANHFLEMIKKLKDSKNITSRQEIMIENAYYSCRPPERQASKKRSRTPIQQYIYNLIYEHLNESSFNRVIKQILKINWERDEPFLFKCLTKIHNGSYEQIFYFAGIVAGLSKYYPLFCLKYVDHVFETLRVELERHDVSSHQNLFMITRLIGELYSFRLIDENTLFESLYTLIRFGHHDTEFYGNPRTVSIIDPPHETIRVRLVCNLLDCCKNFFTKKNNENATHQFLLYFQRYYLMKIVISIDLKLTIDEIIGSLNPGMKRFKSFEEANEAIKNYENHLKAENPNFIPIDIASSIPFKISTVKSTQSEMNKNTQAEDSHFTLEINEREDEALEERKEDKEELERNFQDEFDREFEMLVSESREQRKKEASKEFSIGPILSLGIDEDTSLNNERFRESIKFHVLRKGNNNKTQTATLNIPTESQFIKQHLKSFQEEKEKQEQIKRLTLKLDSMEREQSGRRD